MSQYEKYGEYLKNNGIRASSQRILILKYLNENNNHPTAGKIYDELSGKLPTISKATVYNNLKLFLENGLIKEINIDNTETRYDFNTEMHGHFRCKNCGKIFDIKIEELKLDTSDFSDFQFDSTDVFINGICPDCLNKN